MTHVMMRLLLREAFLVFLKSSIFHVSQSGLMRKTRTELPPLFIPSSSPAPPFAGNPISFCQKLQPENNSNICSSLSTHPITIIERKHTCSDVRIRINVEIYPSIFVFVFVFVFIFIVIIMITSVLCTTLHWPNSPDRRIVRNGSLRPQPHLKIVICKLFLKSAWPYKRIF